MSCLLISFGFIQAQLLAEEKEEDNLLGFVEDEEMKGKNWFKLSRERERELKENYFIEE